MQSRHPDLLSLDNLDHQLRLLSLPVPHLDRLRHLLSSATVVSLPHRRSPGWCLQHQLRQRCLPAKVSDQAFLAIQTAMAMGLLSLQLHEVLHFYSFVLFRSVLLLFHFVPKPVQGPCLRPACPLLRTIWAKQLFQHLLLLISILHLPTPNVSKATVHTLRCFSHQFQQLLHHHSKLLCRIFV